MPSDNLIKSGTTSVIRNFFLRSATTGLALTGKVAGDFSGNRSLAGAVQTALSFAVGAAGDAYSSGKIAEIGGGKYAWHVPDAVFTAAGSSTAELLCSGAITVHFDWQVVTADRGVAAFGANTIAPATPTNVSDVQTAVLAKLPAALVSGRIDASMGAVATDAIAAAGLAADAVAEIQSGLATAANLATVAGYLDTEIAAILADTNELQTDWADGGRLDLILDARASQTTVDDIPTNAEFAAGILPLRYQECVWYSSSGTAGTGAGVGSFDTPSSVWADTLSIAVAKGLKTIQIREGSGTITFTAAVQGYRIIGNGHESHTIACGNQDCTGTLFIGGKITGTINPTTSNVEIRGADVNIVAGGGETHVFNSNIIAIYTPVASTALNITNCYQVVDPFVTGALINCQDAALVKVVCQDFQGTIEFASCATTSIAIYGKGIVQFSATCILGGARVSGHWQVTNLGTITVTQTENVPGNLSTLTTSQVNAEVLDVLNVDTFAEETGIPAATSSLRKKIGWMFMWFRNRVTQTGTTSTLFADDGTTAVGTHTVSDDATTFTSGEGS